MNNTDRTRELLEQIRDAEQGLEGLRQELRRLVWVDLGVAPASADFHCWV